MALPAIQGSPLPTSVRGMDERVPIEQMTSEPYKWICSLSIESADGTKHYGSGFKMLIHLPDLDEYRTVIVTSGSCTFVNGKYAKKITVQFPNQKPIEVGTNYFYAAREYTKTGSAYHDYGLILLQEDSEDGFSWSAIARNEELNNRVVANCGYPEDKRKGTMWITGGEITSVEENRIFYMNSAGDRTDGQSGSPVFTWNGSYWTVLGVHTCSGYPNSATKFTTQMIFRFLKRMNCLKSKSIMSVAYPDVYFRCLNRMGRLRGTINCQYKISIPGFWLGNLSGFYIYPVEMSPSSANQSITKVVIESADFRNVFISMDSKGMSKTDHESGGGEVNCQKQSSAGSWESFILRKERNGAFSFRSVQFPHCYIRLDGRRVGLSGSGGGVLNCQYYDDSSAPVSLLERFYLK